MFYYNDYKRLFKTYYYALFSKTKPLSNDSPYLDLGIIDPSIGTYNLGDHIIHEAVLSELRKIYPNDFITKYPSQVQTSYDAKKMMNEKDFLFLAGTNLLSSNMDVYNQWKIDPGHKLFLKKKVILMGVGWWQYQSTPNRYTRNLYKSILSDKYLHSVRDSYTYNMLNEIGICNVVNTSCPTLWNISPNLCNLVPQSRSSDVVTTLTCYNMNPEYDRKILKILSSKYENVHLWIQGLQDFSYLNTILPDKENIKLVSPTIEAFNLVLNNKNVDYIGTRLHAGIRALQRGVRTLIIAVDNRAYEIGKDVNLNVTTREKIDSIVEFIDYSYKTNIMLPIENIERWKSSQPISSSKQVI